MPIVMAEQITLSTTKNLSITLTNYSIIVVIDNITYFNYTAQENTTHEQKYIISINLTTDIINGTIQTTNTTIYECDLSDVEYEIRRLSDDIQSLEDNADNYNNIEFSIKEAFVQRMQAVESNILQRIKTDNELTDRIRECNDNLIKSKTDEGIAKEQSSSHKTKIDDLEQQETYYIYGFLGLLLICITLSFKEKIMELGDRGFYK